MCSSTCLNVVVAGEGGEDIQDCCDSRVIPGTRNDRLDHWKAWRLAVMLEQEKENWETHSLASSKVNFPSRYCNGPKAWEKLPSERSPVTLRYPKMVGRGREVAGWII